MRLRTLVWRELFERKNQLLTGLLAVLLGITVIVAIKNITFFSEKAVARQLDTLGANVLILPKSVSLQDYYTSDLHSEEFPEEYVTRLVMSDIQGLDNLSPKLSVPVEVQGRSFTLTGILPKNEFQAKASWAGAGIFSRPIGCGVVTDATGTDDEPPKETLVRKRVIETLGADEVVCIDDVHFVGDDRVIITAIESDGRRVQSAKASMIEALWSKRFEKVKVKFSINRKGKTTSSFVGIWTVFGSG